MTKPEPEDQNELPCICGIYEGMRVPRLWAPPEHGGADYCLIGGKLICCGSISILTKSSYPFFAANRIFLRIYKKLHFNTLMHKSIH
jgi:hypothetical protein